VKILEEEIFMNKLTKIGRGLTALAIAPLSGLETKNRNRRFDERIKRVEQKQRHK
jgi:hypothetical protein